MTTLEIKLVKIKLLEEADMGKTPIHVSGGTWILEWVMFLFFSKCGAVGPEPRCVSNGVCLSLLLAHEHRESCRRVASVYRGADSAYT